MPKCSNPIQCQTAERDECKCACNGANHGRLHPLLISDIPEQRAEGEQQLKDLREQQEKDQKEKRKERRQRRAEAKKAL